MQESRADRNVHDILDEHEKQILLQIQDLVSREALLRAKLGQKEIELIEIRRAKVVINAMRPEADRIATYPDANDGEKKLAMTAEELAWHDDDTG
jgi:hypothetical protein